MNVISLFFFPDDWKEWPPVYRSINLKHHPTIRQQNNKVVNKGLCANETHDQSLPPCLTFPPAKQAYFTRVI